mmetsp:Transcript_30991/g.35146  ORF Transcript_30991/g.35146 Transcript_30991/m.35146 type:complete len:138 (-) Transcript_30991:34-447(-)
MLPYSVISKEMKQILREVDYDQLITGNQVVFNQQQQIILMSLAEDFFETSINITSRIKDSVLYPIRTFLQSHCKVMAIKCTGDSHEFGKWILILDDKDYPPAMEEWKIIRLSPKEETSSNNEIKSQSVQYVSRNQRR